MRFIKPQKPQTFDKDSPMMSSHIPCCTHGTLQPTFRLHTGHSRCSAPHQRGGLNLEGFWPYIYIRDMLYIYMHVIIQREIIGMYMNSSFWRIYKISYNIEDLEFWPNWAMWTLALRASYEFWIKQHLHISSAPTASERCSCAPVSPGEARHIPSDSPWRLSDQNGDKVRVITKTGMRVYCKCERNPWVGRPRTFHAWVFSPGFFSFHKTPESVLISNATTASWISHLNTSISPKRLTTPVKLLKNEVLEKESPVGNYHFFGSMIIFGGVSSSAFPVPNFPTFHLKKVPYLSLQPSNVAPLPPLKMQRLGSFFGSRFRRS